MDSHHRKVEEDFERAAVHAVDLLNERFLYYQNTVYATQGLFNSSEKVTEDEWHDFVRSMRIVRNYPGVQSIIFAQYNEFSPATELITQLHNSDVTRLASLPARERGFSVSVHHFEPNEAKSGMLGYDIASEPKTLLALRDACRKQSAVLSQVFSDPNNGHQIARQVMPVFRRGSVLETEPQRHAAMIGWVSISYNVERWLGSFASEIGEKSLHFTVAGEDGEIFFNSSKLQSEQRLSLEQRVHLGGRDWLLTFHSTPTFESSRYGASIHLFPVTALLLTLLLWWMMHGLQGRRQQAEALAQEMTEQLRRSEQRYRTMFESNKAVELLIDPESGSIVDANKAASDYYGYSSDELKSMHITDINTLSAEETRREMKRAETDRRNHFLFKHRHATGEVRDVEVYSGPIDIDGKRLLYSIVHDVTARIEGERALRESEERYHTIIDTTGEGYWLVDLDSLRIIDVNDALCRMLGYTRDEMVGKQPFAFADEHNGRIFAYQATQIDIQRQRNYEMVLRHKEGRDVNVRLVATNMPHGDEKPGQAFAFISDITEWKRTEEQLRIAATFFDTTSEAITVTDANNQIIAVNPAFTQITGYSEEEALGRDPAFLSSGRNNTVFYRNMWQTLERMGRWQGEIWNRRKNGELYPEWLSIVAIRDAAGEVKQYMAVFSDITKRKRDEEKIWQQANYDALTALPNRNLFKDRLHQAMQATHREGNRIALLFLDLDRFKWVNDTLGHASGDLLLQEAAGRLVHTVREVDTVARLGGDEFTVLLTDIKSSADVDRVAESLLRHLGRPFELDGKEAFVSASIGITLYPGDAEDMEQLLANADAAMYTAKEAGRNTFHYFTQKMNDAAQRRLRLETDLRRALERGEMSVHYQPIAEGSGRVVGAEALLRWRHPELGSISPDEFIPLAEEVGSIVEIEQWVMHQACSDAVKFQHEAGRPLFMSVNISSVQCKGDKCQRVLASVLQDTGLEPSTLKLEITERLMMDNTQHVIGLLSDLRGMGVSLAVDDFGTGYSSLSYLKQFPVDVLKIDRAFIEGLPEDKDSVALVEAIVAMAHSLNLHVVGEGVETAEQLGFLNSLGCDLIQGYYFSRPLSYDHFIDFLK